MTTVPIRWQALRFAQLDPDTLYALPKLRAEVFVVGQNGVYLASSGPCVEDGIPHIDMLRSGAASAEHST